MKSDKISLKDDKNQSKHVSGFNSSPGRDRAFLNAVLNRWCGQNDQNFELQYFDKNLSDVKLCNIVSIIYWVLLVKLIGVK